jgi:heme exporter protein CcmD
MNLPEWFSMGGYGVYVWGSYAVALLVMGGEVFLLLRRRKNFPSSPRRGGCAAQQNDAKPH